MRTPFTIPVPRFSLTAAWLAALSLALTGCNGALWGNLVVLVLTVGIFLGTLSLGRSSEATRSGDSSTPTTPRRS